MPVFGLAFIVALYELCALFTQHFKIAFPASIIAMLILYLLLILKMVPLSLVESACKTLLKFMPLYFIPFLVAIMGFKELLASSFWEIFFAVFLSSCITIIFTGLAVELFLNKQKEAEKIKESEDSK